MIIIIIIIIMIQTTLAVVCSRDRIGSRVGVWAPLCRELRRRRHRTRGASPSRYNMCLDTAAPLCFTPFGQRRVWSETG